MIELNKAYLGDCLKVMNQIDNKTIDMILCDLPYGTTRNKWDSIIPFVDLWKQYERIIKDNGAIVLTACQPFTSALVMSNPKLFRYDWVWTKDNTTGFLNAKKMPLRKHESVLVFYKKPPVYNPQYRTGKPYTARRKNQGTPNYNQFRPFDTVNTDGRRYPVSVIDFNCERGLHPTQKPVALFEYLIRTYTNPGDLVLDNCAGSGTTGVAAKNTDRNFILIEKEPQYFEMIQERLARCQQTNPCQQA